MNTKLSSIFVSVLGVAAVSSAQLVNVSGPRPNNDPYSRFFDSGRKLTFSGRVLDIQASMRPSGEKQVTMLVRNADGGGTARVDLGPQWFLDYQVAKVNVGQRVQVSGAKVVLDGHGVIVASQVLLDGQGGQVLALRRPDGNPYWKGREAPRLPEGASLVKGSFKSFSAYYVDKVGYWAGSFETNLGTLTVDLGPQSLYGNGYPSFNLGEPMSLALGRYPREVGKFNSLYPTYMVYGKGAPMHIRNSDGSPAAAQSSQ